MEDFKLTPTTLFADITLGALAGLALFVVVSLLRAEPEPKQRDVSVEDVVDFIVEKMPESYLRKNLLVVFGAEYSESSDELNELLTAYSQMKLDEMEKEKSKKSL